MVSKLETAYIISATAEKVWGLTGLERTHRLLRRVGLKFELQPGLPRKPVGPGLLIRSDVVIDEVLLRALMNAPNTALVIQDGKDVRVLAIHATNTKIGAASWVMERKKTSDSAIMKSGIALKTPEQLAGKFDVKLRKQQVPYAFDLEVSTVKEIEAKTFQAVYKGVTDFVTKFIWPPIALPITQLCARAQIHPNAVTFVSLILVILATMCFWNGQFLMGLVFGWGAALADTVDGKLARVTLTSSKWGNIFDHGIDLIHPPIWWLAWWHGVGVTSGDWLNIAMFIAVGGYIAGKLLEQAFISLFGLKIHMWQKFDSRFRLITARRNPNTAILTLFLLAGAADIGIIALAVWTVLCLLLHLIRLIQAFMSRMRGAEIESWLEA